MEQFEIHMFDDLTSHLEIHVCDHDMVSSREDMLGKLAYCCVIIMQSLCNCYAIVIAQSLLSQLSMIILVWYIIIIIIIKFYYYSKEYTKMNCNFKL